MELSRQLLLSLAIPVMLPIAFTTTEIRPSSSKPITLTTNQEQTISFGMNLVRTPFKIENDRLRYSIGGQYPQIQAANDRRVLRFNREVRRTIARHYVRLTKPNLKELRKRIRDMSEIEILDTAEFDYEVLFQSEELLSIRFHDRNYSFPQVHDVSGYFTLNYDIKRAAAVSLRSLFKPNAKFYRKLVELCAREFNKQGISIYYEDGSLVKFDADFILKYLHDRAEWNITDRGLVLNFDQCTFPDCAHGAPSVTIPYTDFREILNHRSPVYRIIRI